MRLTQSQKQNNYEWVVNSLDIVLGLVGGLAAVFWSALSYSLGDYEQFKYENSLIGSIYPTIPKKTADEDLDLPKDEQQA